MEDAHTHAIAWFLRPTSPHGLKDAFLKALFKKAFHIDAPLGTLECHVAVKKRIETGEVDIEVKGPRWWLIVENKVDAEEDQGQTEKYAAYYEWFSKLNETFCPLFLSLDGTRPKSRDFAWMSYRDLREVLESVIESVPPAPEAEQLARHFIEHIRRELES